MNRALKRSLEVSQLLHVIRKNCTPKSNDRSAVADRLLEDAQRLVVIMQMVICKRITDYRKFLSKSARRRKPNFIRQLTEAYQAKNPDAIYLGSGLPNSETLPIRQIAFTLSDGTEKKLTEAELYSALQYGISRGYPPLVKKWRSILKKYHTPQYHEWDVCMTSGSREGCSKVLDLVIDDGQSVMVQTPCHPAVLGSILPKNPDFIDIGMDEQGALSSEIDRVCRERQLVEGPIPKLLYVNPTGANPVGVVYTTERKKEIYDLARKYNFLILEDDPHYFLHYLDKNPTSFFSLDVDGRVLRTDSFSNIAGPGLRLGSVTGPRPLLAKLGLHVQSSTLHASSLSQVLADKLLDSWNDDGYSQIDTAQKFYRDRRDYMHGVIEKHCSDIAEWSVPKAGLFFWLKVVALSDTTDMIVKNCITAKKIFIVPGCQFYPDNSKSCQYLRLSFSHARFDEFDEGVSKIAAAIKYAMTVEKKKI